MCYAIPGKVIEVKERKVVVDYFGERRTAFNEFENLKIGDYIYAQGGFVIDRILEEEAVKILEFWKETFFKLREADLRISKIEDGRSVSKKTKIILDKALEGFKLKREEVLYLLNLEDEIDKEYLYKVANYIRYKFHKNACCVHGIIEISNYCSCDCLYCGIRRSNKDLNRYRMTEEEILRHLDLMINKYGFKAIVIQSGEDSYYDVERLSSLIKEIKKKFNLLLFISINEVGEEGLRKFYEAGVRGLLLRFETINKELYERFHPEGSFEERVNDIKKAKEIGFLLLTGGLIGLPGESLQDIAEDIFFATRLNPEMYTFGPFLPASDTPLSNFEKPDLEIVLKVTAILRLLNPEGKIVSTTAVETLSPQEGRTRAFLAGANSLMLNLTPEHYKTLYRIYPNRIHENESIEYQIEKAIKDLQDLGRAPTDLGV